MAPYGMLKCMGCIGEISLAILVEKNRSLRYDL